MPVPAHPRCRCCIIPILDSLTLENPSVNMNKDAYIDKPSSEIPGDAQNVRRWYYVNVHNIPTKIDTSLPLIEQAKQACELRNNLKREARSIMSNREDAEMLDRLYPPPTLEELIKKKMKKYNLTREQALYDILRTCGITNSDFDKEFMIKGS